MTAAQINEELEAIRECRMAILKTGISYSRNGLQLTRANMSDLDRREKTLNRQLSRLTNGGIGLGDFR